MFLTVVHNDIPNVDILEVDLFRTEASTCFRLLIDVFQRGTLGLRDWNDKGATNNTKQKHTMIKKHSIVHRTGIRSNINVEGDRARHVP